jgi:hypothetical protein
MQRCQYVAERSVGHHMREKQFGVLERVFGLFEPYNSLGYHLHWLISASCRYGIALRKKSGANE